MTAGRAISFPAVSEQTISTVGPLVLVGGGEFQEGSSFDAELLAQSTGKVLLVPTAAAYERPERILASAREFFAELGGSVEVAPVLGRSDAENPAFAAQVRAARFIYLPGESPLHLRSVLKDSAVLHALVAAWQEGAIIAGSSAGAMALTDPMVDPRGGAFTVGLGLVRDLAVVPHYNGELSAQLKRTMALTPSGCALVALGEQTALLREPDGRWRREGRGELAIYAEGQLADLVALAGKRIW